MELYEEWFEKIRSEEIILSEVKNQTELDQYIASIYMVFLEYLGLNDNSADEYIKDFMEDYFEIENKTNNEIIQNIREDILREFRKCINYCYWEDRDMD